MRLLWLADVLRAAGVQVVEVDGWRTRGADSYGPVRGVIVHETRGSATSTDAGEINVLINGRVGLSGPIAQLYLSRTGVWHVVASGTCHHVKTGWGGPFSGLGNDSLLGIEAQHAESEDWANKPTQYASYVRGVAALVRHMGWPPPVGHKEHQPNDKPDPEFDMSVFRTSVAATGVDDMSAQAESILAAFAGGMPTYTDNAGRTQQFVPVVEIWRMIEFRRGVTNALAAIAEKVDVELDPADLDAIKAAAKEGALSAAEGLAAAVVAALPEGQRVTKADVEQAIRSVLGGLDGATPA